MKKIATLLWLFLFVYSYQAKSQTYTLGVGVAANSPATGAGAYPGPFNNVDQAEHQQYLILASELTALGATAGNITQLAYYMVANNANNGARRTLTGYTIRLKLTAATSIAAYDMVGLTQVYTGNYSPATTNGWNAIPFTTCFAWDGISNILIDQCHVNTAANKATTGATTQYSTVAFNASIAAGGAAVTCITAAGATSVNRPNMQLTIAKKDAAAISSNMLGATIILNQISPINVTIQNNSCNAINTAQVGYNINGTIVTETFNGPLASGANTVYTFITPVAPFTLGFANLKLWITFPDGVNPDGNPANDTLYVNNCFVINDPNANNTSYTGTDFWVGFMLNDDNGIANPLYQMLYLSTVSGTTNVTISTPNIAPPFSVTVAVSSNAITAVQIPNTVSGTTMGLATANTVSNTGIHLTGSTNVPFTVYGLSRELYTADGFLCIPTNALGKDYLAVAPLGLYASGVLGSTHLPAEILIVASANATTATVTLPAGVPAAGHAAGSTFTTPVLNAGQTYLINSGLSGSTTFDLTGTRITSNKPVFILEGSVCPDIGFVTGPTGGGGTVQPNSGGGATQCLYCDHVNEVAIPTQSWGKTYYLNNFSQKPGGSIIRIVNLGPGTTTFSYTGLGAQTLTGAGAYKDYMALGAIQIVANNPIYVMEFCTSQTCDNSTNTDPFITNILPREQWGNAYSFICPTSATQAFASHWVNILKQGTGKVALDGAFLSNALFTQLGVTGVYYANISLPAAGGAHTLVGDSAISAYAYGFTTDDAYGYPASGAALFPILLPVGLNEFTAELNKDEVITKWSTSSEKNCNYFIVERSLDGDFYVEASSKIAAAGTSQTTRNYSFADNNPSRGKMNYYRLRQVDYDGHINYSTIASVNVPFGTLRNVAVSPVPARDVVNISFIADSKGEIMVDIYDVTGKNVLHKNYAALEEGNNAVSLDISELNLGAYVIQISNSNAGIVRTKLIKE